MPEFNLMKRPNVKRIFDRNWRKNSHRIIARRFDKAFFDEERVSGYGGYKYDGRWKAVVETMKERYGINSNSAVLDIGCGKGFLLHDLSEMLPGIKVAGIDVSEYAIENGMDSVKPFMVLANAKKLPYASNSFDLVFCSDTTHNLPIEECAQALREMVRVCKPGGHMFVQVDAYRTEEERANMIAWNLTALTFMSVDDWLEFFKEAGYDGDYYWTIMKNED